MAFKIKVYAGDKRNDLHEVTINDDHLPFTINNDYAKTKIYVRLNSSHFSKKHTNYFNVHTTAQFSIQFDCIFKIPVSGDDLLLGNDFDGKIRLPPGANVALNIVKWFIDPGLEGDIFSDKPHLFGPAISSVNTIKTNDTTYSTTPPQIPITEFVETTENTLKKSPSSLSLNQSSSRMTPRTDKVFTSASARRSYFLSKQSRQEFMFKSDGTTLYSFDFYNGFLDFEHLSLRLPLIGGLPGGFGNLSILPYWDGQMLRYVLKKRDVEGEDEVVFAIVAFELVPLSEDTVVAENEICDLD